MSVLKWIGITGGLGTGKSSVALILKEMGYCVVDADGLAHTVLLKSYDGFEDVLQSFGPEILNSQGEIDRKKLAQEVFQDSQKLKILENIVHPLVEDLKNRRKKQLELKGVKLAFYDVPLLFEKKIQDEFDATLLVYCSVSCQIKRIEQRGDLSEEVIQGILLNQKPLEEKRKLADYVLSNEGTLEETRQEVKKFIQKIHLRFFEGQ